MTVRDLLDRLALLDPALDVEIATRPESDQWYEIRTVGTGPNLRGRTVAVLTADSYENDQ